jgi:hypothetical protein
MAKKSGNSKKMEALARAQKIGELLKLGGIQSQALLDSAGETRATDESHVADLLNSGSFGRSPEASVVPQKKSKKSKAKPKKSAAKKRKR